MEARKFAVLGGDNRQKFLIKNLVNDGADVCVCGFDDMDFEKRATKCKFEEAVKNSDFIIFPLSATKDGKSLNAPFSKDKIFLNNKLSSFLSFKKVFCGMSEKLESISSDFKKIKLRDYSKREEFAIRNAVPTAEGALEIAIKEYDGTIANSNCLITGFGRIGKVLASMLFSLRANVAVSARKPHDLANIETLNYKPILTNEISKTNGYDIIFNTIPKVIFDSSTLAKSAKDSIIIDLASNPGGVDCAFASKLGIKVIRALSIPGKVAPKTAASIIKSTIYNMIDEEERYEA